MILHLDIPRHRLVEVGVVAACLALSGAAVLRARSCAGLSAAVTSRLADYIVTWRHLPLDTKLKLTDSHLLPGSCMRQAIFADDGGRRYAVTLSPDQKYAFGGARESTPAALMGSGIVHGTANHAASTTSGDLDSAAFTSLLDGTANGSLPPALGPATAPVTIIEFSDFECPFCRRLANTLQTQVLPAEHGSVRLVYHQFPLPMHPWAEAAAELSNCVGQQSVPAFWRLHDYFFAHQDDMNATLTGTGSSAASSRVSLALARMTAHFLASDSSLDQTRLRACQADPATRAQVQADIELGQKFGVTGTPTLFINGARLTGARDADELEAAIATQKTKPLLPKE